MNRVAAVMAALLTLAAFSIPTAALADADRGKKLFVMNCSSCHGNGGKGDGPVGKALNPPPRDFTVGDFKIDANKDGKPGEDADLKLVIKNGAATYGGSPMMAPWPALGDGDVDSIIVFVRSLKE